MEISVKKIESGTWWVFKLYSLESIGEGFIKWQKKKKKKTYFSYPKSKKAIVTQQRKHEKGLWFFMNQASDDTVFSWCFLSVYK